MKKNILLIFLFVLTVLADYRLAMASSLPKATKGRVSKIAANHRARVKECAQLLGAEPKSYDVKTTDEKKSEPPTIWSRIYNLKNKADEELVGQDPFAQVTELSDSISLLNQLSYNFRPNGKAEPNILNKIRVLLRRGEPKQNEVNKLADELLAYSKEILLLEESDASTAKLKNKKLPDIKPKDLLVFKVSAEVLLGLQAQMQPRPPHEKDEEATPPEKTNEEKDQQKKEKQKKPKQPPPEFMPELPEEYQVKPSPEDDPDGAQQEKAVFYDFNEKAMYFKQFEYNFLSRTGTNFKVMALPFRKAESVREGTSRLKMKVVTKNAKLVKLFLPTGYVPLTPATSANIQITKTAEGHYVLQADGSQNEISLPMTPTPHEDLNAADLEILTSPLGVKDSEWPRDIQLNLLGKKFGGVLATAHEVKKYISSKYLYSKSAPAIDPIAAVEAGQFKCDMAAMVMTSLMRDHFKMPCRVVSGFRANKRQGENAPHSVLVLPSDAHAWVECFAEGQWHTFDPTPTKQAKKQNGEADPDNKFVPQQDNEQSDELSLVDMPDSDPTKGQGQGEKKDSDKKKGELVGDENGDKEKNGESKTDKPDKSVPEGSAPTELQLGSQSLKKHGGPTNPLVREAIMNFYRESFNPHLPQSKVIENLSLLSAAKLGQEWQMIDQVMSESLSQLGSARPQLSQHLRMIGAKLKSSPLEDSYKEFFSAWFRAMAYQSLITDTQDTPSMDVLMRTFEQAEREFRKLEAAHAENVKLAIAFLRSLPKITRSVVLKDYNISVAGNNPATERLGKALKEKKLSSIALIRELYPLTDFITEPISSPMYRNVKTWNYKNRRGRDYLIMNDPTNLMRGLPADPTRSRSENYQAGQLVDPRRRQISKLPANTGIQEPERISIVLYDTSGSMGGTPGDFQAGLIAAFADRALSDVTREGRHLHKLMVMGFDDVVHNSKALLTTSDAQNLIRNYRSEMKNRGAGTNIMAALQEAFGQIESAQKQKGEPLANANIILMTDGQADIDVEKIKQMRARIDRSTRVQLLFVAIGTTNPELEEFCTSDAKYKTNLSKTQFYYFSEEVMGNAINKAIEGQNKINGDVLVSDVKAQDVPDYLMQTILTVADRAEQYENLLALRPMPDIRRIYNYVDTQMNINVQKSDDRTLSIQINGLRSLLAQENSKSLVRHSSFRYIMLSLINRFERLARKPVNQLSIEEAEELKHLMREINAKI